jgi:preprotein translocase subunit YajC
MTILFSAVAASGRAPIPLPGLLQGSAKDMVGFLVPMLAFFAIFYFLLILPAQRRQKKANEMLAALKAGDKVITNGGIYGTIAGLEGDAVLLRIAEQVKIKVARSAISGLQRETEEKEKKEK